MWLLNTTTAELEYFGGPDDRQLLEDGGYAILSHVWRNNPKEQSFQEIQALRSHKPTPRSVVSDKIQNCCILAESHAYRWIWIDTCCIDKTSSSELSEAINSMFQWYSKAAVCYAYLDDVCIDDLDLDRHDSQGHRPSTLRSSRWFGRGWTLQELIAPRHVLFLMNDWSILGTRTQLVKHVHTITGIDEDVLLHRRDLGKVSIARRMSWASARKTTRVEDEAYCLLGVFGVNMPTIYGEGRAAFYRLQEEILKISPDHSIFAWGPKIALDTCFQSENSTHRSTPKKFFIDERCLFAPSPKMFADSNIEAISIAHAVKIVEAACLKMVSSSSSEFQVNSSFFSHTDSKEDEKRVSKFSITSQGMQSTLPILTLSNLPVDSKSHASQLKIAVLGCRYASTQAVVGLTLSSRSRRFEFWGDSDIHEVRPDIPIQFSDYRLVEFQAPDQYHVGRGDSDGNGDSKMDNDLAPSGSLSKDTDQLGSVAYGDMSWTTVYILHRPLPHMTQTIVGLRTWKDFAFYYLVHFRLSNWSLQVLRQWGFRPQVDSPSAFYPDGGYSLENLMFRSDAIPEETFTVKLEMCPRSHSLSVTTLHLRPFHPFHATARVSFGISSLDLDSIPKPHQRVEVTGTPDDCCLAQIEREQNSARTFGNQDRMVELTFNVDDVVRDSHLTRLLVYLVDIKVSGKVYKSLREQAAQNKMRHVIHPISFRRDSTQDDGEEKSGEESSEGSVFYSCDEGSDGDDDYRVIARGDVIARLSL